MLLTVFSGCGIARPNADICIVNAPAQYLICWNLQKDYDKNGRIKPGVQPHYKPAASIEDVNKFMVMDPDSWAATKAYINKLKAACQ